MKVDLRKLVPNSSGYILKIEEGHYGKNYQDNYLYEASDGDIFLYALPNGGSVLIKIEGEKAVELCRDQFSDQHTFAYIKSLRK